MKAIKELGTLKIAKFIFFTFVSSIYHLSIDHVFNLTPFRKYFLILLGAKIGKDSIVMRIHFFNWHYGGPGFLKIGDECFIGDEVLIDLYNQVQLENQVTIAKMYSHHNGIFAN